MYYIQILESEVICHSGQHLYVHMYVNIKCLILICLVSLMIIHFLASLAAKIIFLVQKMMYFKILSENLQPHVFVY